MPPPGAGPTAQRVWWRTAGRGDGGRLGGAGWLGRGRRGEDGGPRPQGQLPDPPTAGAVLPGVAGAVQGPLCTAAASGCVSGAGPSGTPALQSSEAAGRRGQTTGALWPRPSRLPRRSTAPPPNHSGNLATRFFGRCVEHSRADSCEHSSGGRGTSGVRPLLCTPSGGRWRSSEGTGREAVLEGTGDWTAHLLGEKPRCPERALTPPRLLNLSSGGLLRRHCGPTSCSVSSEAAQGLLPTRFETDGVPHPQAIYFRPIPLPMPACPHPRVVWKEGPRVPAPLGKAFAFGDVLSGKDKHTARPADGRPVPSVIRRQAAFCQFSPWEAGRLRRL